MFTLQANSFAQNSQVLIGSDLLVFSVSWSSALQEDEMRAYLEGEMAKVCAYPWMREEKEEEEEEEEEEEQSEEEEEERERRRERESVCVCLCVFVYTSQLLAI
jgi:CO dehydrogenase/acetyl-CoA synthase beta subunit